MKSHFDRDGPALMSIAFHELDGNELGNFFPKRSQQANTMQAKTSAESDSELLEF